MSEKVYCDKCRYFYSRGSSDPADAKEECIHSSNIYFAPFDQSSKHLSSSEDVHKQYKSNLSSLNGNNQCTNYEYSFYHPNKETIWIITIFFIIPAIIFIANIIVG